MENSLPALCAPDLPRMMPRFTCSVLKKPLLGYAIPHMLTSCTLRWHISRFAHTYKSLQACQSDFFINGYTMKPTLSDSGARGTLEYRGFFRDESGQTVSPWHSIPYKCPSSGLYNMVVEIPRHTTAKMEIATKLENNPIKQDVLKCGSLRFLDCPYYWNYGAIPQTWEAPIQYGADDPHMKGLSLVGDNDPVDAIDVSQTTMPFGSVVQVKVVGALALVDEGEIDWKMFVVRSDDPHFDDIKDFEDIDRFYPGTTTGVMEFFRWYKTPKGKPINQFLAGKTFVGREEAVKVLEEMHDSYQKLLSGELSAGGLWVPKA